MPKEKIVFPIIETVVLAAGRGTRMASDLPKVLHPVGNRRMIEYVLEAVRQSGLGEPILVVGWGEEAVKSALGRKRRYALQATPRGTGDAVAAAVSHLHPEATHLIVLIGDNPLLRSKTLKALKKIARSTAVIGLATAKKKDAGKLGRIKRDKAGKILGIVEWKDATQEERAIQEFNAGFYIFAVDWLKHALKKLIPSPVTGEYYLTDLVEQAIQAGHEVASIELVDHREGLGINTAQELEEIEAILNRWNKEND